MKRGAEKQLAKDDRDEEEEVDEPGQGFKKADDSVLAGRKIRGLPKRLAGGQNVAATATPEAQPPAVPKFGGFGGFGGAAASTNPFSFGAPSKPAAPAAPTSAFSSIPATASTTPAFSTSLTTSPTPTLSSSASSAAKTFASFLGTPPEPKPTTNGTRSQKDAPAQDSQKDAPAQDVRLKAETKYYRSLRGLNVSFVNVITKAVDSDPFLDIAGVLEQYKSLRAKVKQEYDEDVKKAESAAPTTSSFAFGAPKVPSIPAPPAAPSTPFSFGAAPPASSQTKVTSSSTTSPFTFGTRPATSTDGQPTPAMPAPPSGFAGFGFAATSSSTSTSAGGGFTPKLDCSSSGSSGFTFGSSSSAADSAPAPPKSAFSFGPAATSKSSFAFGDPSSKPSEPSAAPSIFSSNLFSSASKDEPKDAVKTTSSTITSGAFSGLGDKPTTSTPTKSLFGAGSSSKPFGFGSAGSIGNPLGFSFGSPPKTPDESKPPAPSSGFGAFTFGAPAKTASTSEAGGDTDASSRADTPADDAPVPAPLVAASSVHDLEGEGEEDEETKYEVRTKVYRLMKKRDESQEWTDVGIGMLRVKAHKETGNRRLLLRNSSTGKITINFNVYNGMNPSVAKNVVSFMGHDEGKSVAFKLRVKTPDQANDLKDALEREIEFVKSKSSD